MENLYINLIIKQVGILKPLSGTIDVACEKKDLKSSMLNFCNKYESEMLPLFKTKGEKGKYYIRKPGVLFCGGFSGKFQWIILLDQDLTNQQVITYVGEIYRVILFTHSIPRGLKRHRMNGLNMEPKNSYCIGFMKKEGQTILLYENKCFFSKKRETWRYFVAYGQFILPLADQGKKLLSLTNGKMMAIEGLDGEFEVNLNPM